MKILYVAHEGGDNFNGASRSLLTLVDYFQREHEVYVLVPNDYGILYEELKKRKCKVIVEKYHRHVIYKNKKSWKWGIKKILWGLYQKPQNRIVAKRLSRYIKVEGIEIVHSNSSVVDIGAIAAKNANCKHVWHFREFAQEDFNMYPLEGNAKFINSIKKNSDIIITVSKAVARKYEKELPQGKIHTVYNGLEIPSDVKHQEHKGFNLLISGMVTETKGQEIALQAMRMIIKNGFTDIHLYVAGRGNEVDLKNKFIDIEKNAHFLGQVNDMVELRSRMDVELVCSRSEAFGRVTIEAMLCEIPVIGSNSGGTSELITKNSGMLYEYGNIEKLVSCIMWAYNQKKEIKDMGRFARRYAIENFSEEMYVKKISNLYEMLIKKARL